MKVLLACVIVLALGWAVTLWKASRNEAQAIADYPPLGSFMTVGDVRLHYVQEGSGPDVVLIHGASGNVRDFTFDLVGRLSDRYRVTVFDRPGLGYSDALGQGQASIFDQSGVLQAASDQLGLTRPVLVGHSYGGAVALAWATRHPGHAGALVVLSGASNPWPGPLSTYYRVLSHPAGQRVAVPLLTAWVPEHVVTDTIAQIFAPQSTPEGYADYVGAGLTLQRRALRENALQRASILGEVIAMVPDYGALDLPVEILHGDADTTVWPQVHAIPLSEQVTGANLVVMPGIGHSPHHADPDTVVASIDRAVARALQNN